MLGSGSGSASVLGSAIGSAIGSGLESLLGVKVIDPTPPLSYPREKGSPVYSLPIEREGPSDFFPAVCLQSHWDATAILRHTLPKEYVPQALDPRPWTRICMEYTTAGGQEPAPATNPNTVMPNGGQFYPSDRYSAAIDAESKLRSLDRKLGTCETNQWKPTASSDMYDARVLIPDNVAPSDPNKIQEIAYPKALLRSGPYQCREENDVYNVRASSDYTFNNATKQDRYKKMNKPTKPEAPEAVLKAATEPFKRDIFTNAGPPDPTRVMDAMPTGSGSTDKYDTHFAPG
jgi:hypothetical protein